MTKEQQNLAWACLPKEYREELRRLYKDGTKHNKINRIAIYKSLFGRHNLTSDTEPEEILMVERSKIIQNYTNALERAKESNKPIETYIEGYYDGQTAILEELFGDKCLLDKEEPKFKVGDIVKVNNPRYNQHFGATGVIKSIEEFVGGTYVYTLENYTS